MGVPQYTSPTFTLTFNEEELDLTTARNVYVTFRSKERVLTKTGEDLVVDPKTISVYVSQAECANFYIGTLLIQANWIDDMGNRIASDIVRCDVTDNLLKQVVE